MYVCLNVVIKIIVIAYLNKSTVLFYINIHIFIIYLYYLYKHNSKQAKSIRKHFKLQLKREQYFLKITTKMSNSH